MDPRFKLPKAVFDEMEEVQESLVEAGDARNAARLARALGLLEGKGIKPDKDEPIGFAPRKHDAE